MAIGQMAINGQKQKQFWNQWAKCNNLAACQIQNFKLFSIRIPLTHRFKDKPINWFCTSISEHEQAQTQTCGDWFCCRKPGDLGRNQKDNVTIIEFWLGLTDRRKEGQWILAQIHCPSFRKCHFPWKMTLWTCRPPCVSKKIFRDMASTHWLRKNTWFCPNSGSSLPPFYGRLQRFFSIFLSRH